MADIQHSTISDPDLHEPKGASTATSNKTYVSDGAGSGSWTEPEPKDIATANSGDVYVADGAGSGSWTPETASSYGAMRFTEVGSEFNVTASGTYKLVTGANLVTPGALWTAGQLENVTFLNDSNNERLRVSVGGDYVGTLTLSYTALTAISTWGMSVSINGGSPTSVAVANATSEIGDTQQMSLSGIITVSANDTIQMTIKNLTGTNNCDLESAVVAVHLLKAS